ncbi:MAG: TGS domain-containing protein [Planctomycetes bacterium]|nr:TGS domain-containing protein [Planctomycetota bacterium]
MPANLTPDYKKADDWYRSASTDEEKLAALEEMLRTIPKHKGTEGLQADIKRKMSKLRASVESGVKKGGVKHADVFHIPRSGAGQVVLIGLPNSGKSSIVAHLTNAHVNVADYPFATDKPVPGMMKHEDVPIQLVDTPPITAEFAPSGLVNTLRSADIIGIVIDLSVDVLEQIEVCIKYLDSHKLLMPADAAKDAEWVHLARPAFVIATKADIAPAGTLDTLKELTTRPFEYIEISTKTATGLDVFTRRCFEILDVVRVYAKKPGKEPDMQEPFMLPRGSTVQDLAYHIHRQLAEHLKSARAWHSSSVHDGQSVPREHVLTDKEIIELHFG